MQKLYGDVEQGIYIVGCTELERVKLWIQKVNWVGVCGFGLQNSPRKYTEANIRRTM